MSFDRRFRGLLFAGLALVSAQLCLPAVCRAQDAPQEEEKGPVVLGTCWSEAATDSASVSIAVNLDDATGPVWMLMVSFDDFATLPMLIGPLPLPADGQGLVSGTLPDGLGLDGLMLSFRGLWLDNGHVKLSNISQMVMGPMPGCSVLDADFGVGGVPLLAGELVSEQWGAVGIHVSCTSQLPGSQPNKCIIFDSANPTGGDEDLATPGYGPGNTVAEGKLFIIAENDVDANNDGYVDDPDDAYNGGLIHFDFDSPVAICSATLIDIDDSEPNTGITKLRFYKDNAGTQLITAITISPAGDNSAQTVNFLVEGVRRFDVKAGGSLGLPRFSFCPTCVDFDSTTVGIPLDLQAGEVITDQFADLGFLVSATNQTAGHPNKAILFDSANPTGGDTDLVTPGYGPGNTIAEGKLLIIAENDVDANNDGLVDDPDDEADGGNVFLDFDYDVKDVMVTIIDVDTGGTHFVQGIDKDNVIVGTANFAFLGDNSRQQVSLDVGGIRRLKIHLGGSAGIAEICFCPDP